MNVLISGLFKEVSSPTSERKMKGTELALRVDIDGNRPLDVVSGDLYSISNKTRRYAGSFIFRDVEKIKTAKNEYLVTGKSGTFDFAPNQFADIKIAISTCSLPFTADAQLIDDSGKVSNHLCTYESKYFRSVQIEHQKEEGVIPFEYYDPAELLMGSERWVHPISIASAFAEAGIEIKLMENESKSISHPEFVPVKGSVWTDERLTAAIPEHFRSLWYRPQWKLWLFSALKYTIPNTRGKVIFYGGKRVGCAVFQNATGWQNSVERRRRLFVYIHELGHCFNLPHAWFAREGNSLIEDGHATLSWMSYPLAYYASKTSHGRDDFWRLFNFQFSNLELLHLRHAFRNDIIPGGRNFKDLQ
jgi:hypothetical protein